MGFLFHLCKVYFTKGKIVCLGLLQILSTVFQNVQQNAGVLNYCLMIRATDYFLLRILDQI